MDIRPSLPLFKHIILPDIILILLVAVWPSIFIRFIGFSALTYLYVASLWFTVGNATQDYFIGFVLASQLLLAVQLLWLTVPIRALRHERDKAPPHEMQLWRRVYWAFCLVHSVRAVGWTHQVRNVPRRPKMHRWSFVRSRILHAVWYFIIADVANTYIIYVAALDITSSQGYALHCSTIVAWVGVTYALANVQYFTLAAMSVGFGAGLSQDWPDVFGKWSDAYTLRKFWGQVWHQNLRRVFTPISKVITDFCGFKKGTKLSSYTQLYTSFLLSGLIHSIGDTMVGWKWAGSSMPFFLIQAMAITVEDAVIAFSRELGISQTRFTRLIGYLWVFSWGAYTFSLYRDLGVEAGWGWSTEWPLSPTRILWSGLKKLYRM